MKVEISFPKTFLIRDVKFSLEMLVEKYSLKKCSVKFLCEREGENLFKIESESPEVFFIAGIVSGLLMKGKL